MATEKLFWMSKLKLERAGVLIKEVATELERYRQDPDIEHRMYEEGNGWVLETNVKSTPVMAGAIMGDVLHNLRSSLDLMACELARLNNQSDKGVYFPVADSKDGLKEQIARKNFDRCGQDAVDLLESLEPYRGGNIALRALHDLNIDDKHKIIVETNQQIMLSANIPFENGKLLPHLATYGHQPESLKLVFPAEGPFAGDQIVPTLEHLMQTVDGIIEAFERLVALRKPAS